MVFGCVGVFLFDILDFCAVDVCLGVWYLIEYGAWLSWAERIIGGLLEYDFTTYCWALSLVFCLNDEAVMAVSIGFIKGDSS